MKEPAETVGTAPGPGPSTARALGPFDAVALLSGGLDSTLAIRVLQEQGLRILALNFTSPFCTCSPRRENGCHMAGEVARSLGVEVRVLGKGRPFLEIVRQPRFGRGRGMNPCIDCRIFMLRKAAELLEETGASFVVTGEVLGQRPMSQHLRALRTIERESGLEGRLLRPLSARHLEPTRPEREGLVDRRALLAIRGRSRKEQLSLARDKGIDVFSCPAGGCLLTDPAVARRVEDLFRHVADWDMADARLTTLGRHFRLHGALKAILGRDEAENRRLEALSGSLDRMELEDVAGPLLVLRGTCAEDDLPVLGGLLLRYAKKAPRRGARVQWIREGSETTFTVDAGSSEEDIDRLRI